MLMRTEAPRELDRFAQPVLGTAARPAAVPMDAWRRNGEVIIEFDLPGVTRDSLDLKIERNVLTVRAERPDIGQNREVLSAERVRGLFTRQLVLGENLDTDKIRARYHRGVLRVAIPLTERAKPRRIEINRRRAADGGSRAVGRAPLWRRLWPRR
ncbi:hypothetical protein AWB95_04390 [Mycobacterium celatum]|uniref:SHSP domain-containing protein n=1 Tax=Mycobacterium celatum TaxID=28045 RepID=A0A1X1RVE5_MYCCE|nr:hypothetical protein AWB95_04390 [Mycobacterium celatum]